MIATTGGKYPKMKTMPLSTSTASGPTKLLLEKAHVEANRDPHVPDRDLELPAGELPKWTTHSLRRLADTTARRYRDEVGVSEAMIDIFFGWQERVLKKAMQVHYAAMSIRERMRTAKITGMM